MPAVTAGAIQPIDRRDLFGAAASAAVVVVAAIVFYHFDHAFFWKDDFQLQYLPASREVVRAWQEGSFPLLSRFSWYGGALAGEFQHGVFSLFVTACNLLVWSIPLELSSRAVMLSSFHLAVMAAGVFLLGRSYGMRAPLATAAAFAVTLNGWNLFWGAATWYPALTSFAWLPWYWLSLRHASRSRLAWFGGGLSFYCLVAAGWPYTILMSGLLTLLELLKGRHNRAALASIATAAILGLALSAPATLMLLEYFRATYRVGQGAQLDVRWVVPPSGLLGAILPTIRTDWRLWLGPMPHSAVELAGGLVPLAGLTAAAATRRWRIFRELRGELILLEFLVLLAVSPSIGIFRWPFRWLPLLHLLLAIAGFAAIQRISDESARMRDRVGLWCGLLIVAAVALAWSVDLQIGTTSRYAIVLLLLAALWTVCGTRIAHAGAMAMTIGSIAVLFVFFPQVREVPVWPFDSSVLAQRPFDPRLRYLQIAQWWTDGLTSNPGEPRRLIYGTGESLRPGNTPMFAGLEFVNGYSPLSPSGLHQLLGFDIHGPIRIDYVDSVAARETAPGALLDHMSVDGLVLPGRWIQRTEGWVWEDGRWD